MLQHRRSIRLFGAGIAVAAVAIGSWLVFQSTQTSNASDSGACASAATAAPTRQTGTSVANASSATPVAGASGVAAFGDSVRTILQDGNTPIACVNGVVIPASKVKAYGILSAAGFGVAGAPKISASQYLDSLINSEVLYREAAKEGFDPTDSAVHDLAVQEKTGLEGVLAQNTDDAAKLREAFAEVKGTPYSIDVYDTSPQMLDGFRRQIAVNALEAHVTSQLPVADQNNPAKRQAAIDALTTALRSKANIQILGPVSY